MAARTSKDPAEQTPPAAMVRTQEYSAGTGWEIGQTAPEDAYRALDGDGHNTPTGPVVSSHPGGYARLIVAKGAQVTDGVRRELDAAEAEQDGGA
ncbi:MULTISPECIES: hypothetical protein [unclassified Streptomyces]|uniref:hypothetical protein n=1 Tax=unclassified Streptomyces TaxID=2593676 RepID=UPI00093CCBE3|nr:hypothetical protein [Streptomyces sp. CB02366]OKJ38209.1 hypothetical protein AMK24_11105 [Streptomyces sp. CB02366]